MISISQGTLLILVCAAFSLLYFSLQPLKNCLLAHYAPKRAQGLTFGFIFFLEFGIGSFGSSLGGYLADSWDIATIFKLIAVILAAMAGVAALLIPVSGVESETEEGAVREVA
jgi:MFS family permease